MQVLEWAGNRAYAIGIKIGRGVEPTMICLVAYQDESGVLQHHEQQFGLRHCTQVGTHVVQVPLSAAFRGYPWPTEFQANEQPLVLDLRAIQQTALRHMRRPAS